VIDARVGQPVVVGLPESVFLRLVFHLYLLPLLAGLAGAVIGHYLSVKNQLAPSVTDGIALLGAIMAAAIAMAWNRRRSREFPRMNAVHLLRGIDRAHADRCSDPAPINRSR
jgi:positive regulator of sigma E activity